MPRVADLVAAAKLWLVSEGTADLPYLSQGLYALATVESAAVRRVATDEQWRLYVNPTWAERTSVEDLAREIAHQLWHLLLDHAGRARSVGVDRATVRAWRAASDLGIVDALGDTAPPLLACAAELLRDEHPALTPGLTTEEAWAVLTGLPPRDDDAQGDGEADDDPDEGSAADGRRRSWELPPEADVGGLDAVAAGQVREGVAIEYRASARGQRGDQPAELARWARRVLEPTLPWERLLAQATRQGVGWTSGRTHTTFTRPNRRASSLPGVILPGWRRPNPRVACVVDTSGSVDDVLLGRAMAEVDGALRGLGVGGGDVTVLACDAAVHAVKRVRRARDAVLVGGGGTDLRVALAAIERLRPRPTLCVVLSDGYTPWPDRPPPGCAVVVALLLREGQEAPPVPEWATAIRCQLER